MKDDERVELARLETAERAGQVLTGAERGRLWDLRKMDILGSIAELLPHKSPGIAKRETR